MAGAERGTGAASGFPRPACRRILPPSTPNQPGTHHDQPSIYATRISANRGGRRGRPLRHHFHRPGRARQAARQRARDRRPYRRRRPGQFLRVSALQGLPERGGCRSPTRTGGRPTQTCAAARPMPISAKCWPAPTSTPWSSPRRTTGTCRSPSRRHGRRRTPTWRSRWGSASSKTWPAARSFRSMAASSNTAPSSGVRAIAAWLRAGPQRSDRQDHAAGGHRPQRRPGRIDEGNRRAAESRLRYVGRSRAPGALHGRSLPSAGNLLDLRLLDRLPGRLGRPSAGHPGLGQRRRPGRADDVRRHRRDPRARACTTRSSTGT